MPYMYVLECSDGTYYTGSTWDLERRLEEHNGIYDTPTEDRGANYTRKRRPVKLVYSERYNSIKKAFEREKQVQGWTRKKKKALINGSLDDLPSISKKDFK